MDMDVGGTLFIGVIGIFVLLLLREVFCWYYKINAIKEIMEEQRDLLKKLVDKQTE